MFLSHDLKMNINLNPASDPQLQQVISVESKAHTYNPPEMGPRGPHACSCHAWASGISLVLQSRAAHRNTQFLGRLNSFTSKTNFSCSIVMLMSSLQKHALPQLTRRTIINESDYRWSFTPNQIKNKTQSYWLQTHG